MLKKQQRLTRKEFDQYFKSGKRFHHTLLQLVYSPSDQFHGAVVVGKKVAKSAVARNRKRRQIYNCLYKIHKAEKLSGVYILLTKPEASKASYGEFAVAIAQLVAGANKKS